jgi:hypothetical protein
MKVTVERSILRLGIPRRARCVLLGSVLGLMLPLVAATSASASTTVVVRPSSMDSWATQARDSTGTPVPLGDPSCNGSVSFVNGPATPPLGVGSVELKTGNGTAGGDCSAEVRNSAYTGVTLASLTALSYWTYDVTNNGQQFPYLELNINTTGTGTTPDDALFFEPPYQATGAGGTDCAHQAATTMNTWQKWDALGGCWWNNLGNLNPGTGTGTLVDYMATYPNATIVNSSTGGGVHFVVGFASPGDRFDGNVDAFTINSTTYDFEPNSTPPSCPGGFAITTPSPLPSTTHGVPYSTTLAGCGGTPPYSFKKMGKLPKGLKLNHSGVISGTPKKAGTSTFKVKMTDKAKKPKHTVTQTYSITVN